MTTADEIVVTAPAGGSLGLTLAPSMAGPTVDMLSSDSPLQLHCAVGWKLVAVNGVSTVHMDYLSAAQLIRSTDGTERERRLTFRDPSRALRARTCNDLSETPATGRMVVKAPAGRLGLVLATGGGSGPYVHEVRAASPLATRVHVGWRLSLIDGQDVSQMTYLEAAVVLKKSAGRVRTLTFEAPHPPSKPCKPWRGLALRMLGLAFATIVVRQLAVDRSWCGLALEVLV